MSYFNEIDFNAALKDKFGNLNVVEPHTIFSSKLLNDKQPFFWDEAQVTGGGCTSTFNTNRASVTLACSNLTAGRYVRSTYQRFNYQTGKAQRVIRSCVFGDFATGINVRTGYFDDKNGLFFEKTPTVIRFVHRTYTSGVAVDNTINQSAWNIDKLDGTGNSGKTLNKTKTSLYFIEFGWLGVDGFIFGFFIDGKKIICHMYNSANNDALVYMSSPNLPLRDEIVNDGTGPVSSFTTICSAVQSAGGEDVTGRPVIVSRESTSLVTANDSNIYCLAAFRLRSGYESAFVDMKKLSIICTSTAAYRVIILRNPTVTGTALSWTTLTDTPIENDVSRTNTTTLSGGTKIFEDFNINSNEADGNVNVNCEFYLGSSIAGVNDIVAIGIQRLTGTSETFYGCLNLNVKE
jgi:hypothetical protein